MQFQNHRRTALQYSLVHWTLCCCQQYSAFSMKVLARYQVILLGEQRHIRCTQLVQGCCPNNAAVGVEPATSWSRVQRSTATIPIHTSSFKAPSHYVGRGTGLKQHTMQNIAKRNYPASVVSYDKRPANETNLFYNTLRIQRGVAITLKCNVKPNHVHEGNSIKC